MRVLIYIIKILKNNQNKGINEYIGYSSTGNVLKTLVQHMDGCCEGQQIFARARLLTQQRKGQTTERNF